MWNPFKKKDSGQAPADPAGVHPKHKAAAAKPAESAPSKGDSDKFEEYRRRARQQQASGLSDADIDGLRRMKFEKLGIPYDRILAVEKTGVPQIDPKKIESSAASINSGLSSMGFNFHISCLELFDSWLLLTQYENHRKEMLKKNSKALPEHNLLDTVIVREAERLARLKLNLQENPASGSAAETFQKEVRGLIERMRNESQLRQLRLLAVRRIKKEKKQQGNEPVLESEVAAMVEKIKAELKARDKKS